MKILSLKVFLFSILLIIFTSSCASLKLKDSINVQKVDKKILGEFYDYIKKGEFYEASGSYIEFVNYSEDGVDTKLFEDLTQLYRTKIDELEKNKDLLSIIEYTYSFINLIEGNTGSLRINNHQLEGYKENLKSYIKSFIDSKMNDRGRLERVSWLIYLASLSHNDSDIYRLLVDVLLEEDNSLIAQRFFKIYRSVLEMEGSPDIVEGTEELESKILKAKEVREREGEESAIEETIKSSVKIIVDKGIKTESGVGIPDQILGTGVVIDERGYILTNYHIIESSVDPKYEGYSRVYVIPGTDDSIRFVAKVIGYDSVFDIALLKIEKKMDSYVIFGDSDILHQGETVVAIGNPIGLTNTVTSGVVSSIDRPFLQIGNIIQIDAALNPGNSGGALINKDGYLIGIAFAGFLNFENLNFAIPSNLVLSILFRLYEGGEVRRGWIGCLVSELEGGIEIEYIVPDSPASVYGLMKGDIIREVNKIPVNKVLDIHNAISYFNNPMVLTLTIERESKNIMRNVLVENRPASPSLYIYDRDANENIVTPLFGIVVTRAESQRKQAYLVKRIITGSVASSIGIAEGDVIKMKDIKYDEKNRVFYLYIDLKSKRLGYISRNMVLYSYFEANTFI